MEWIPSDWEESGPAAKDYEHDSDTTRPCLDLSELTDWFIRLLR